MSADVLPTEDVVLLNCPFCGGRAAFHQHQEDCPSGCHYIQCSTCKVIVDFGTTADPKNEDLSLEQLRNRIAPFWNNAVASFDGYKGAFYQIVDLIGLGAMPLSPKETFETVIMPRLRELVSREAS